MLKLLIIESTNRISDIMNQKKSILLLHGALGTLNQFDTITPILQTHFEVHRFNFPGHGGRPILTDFSLNSFVESVLEYIQKNRLQTPVVFGYSMGGYAALKAEALSPGTFKKIISLGTKLNWSVESTHHQISYLNPDLIVQKSPKYAEALTTLHHPIDYTSFLVLTQKMIKILSEEQFLTPEEINKIKCKVHLLVGDRDSMVTYSETEEFKNKLNHAECHVFENTRHPIEMIDQRLLARQIEDIINA